MVTVDLRGERFRDRVMGCWIGKNSGGTLGSPIEKPWGQAEPFDLTWYPEIAEGGIPNDDLEMQLFWLLALEDVGPALDSHDLSRYWLNHIGYNFDEYGVFKENLRLGLRPPISGAYNNEFFRDCMGSPIRSEIWACVAPGLPRLAAHYAYLDAVVDHAGGESVFGEIFNAALESAAFVIDDRETLLDIAMSYLPAGGATRRTIQVARDSHAAGLSWQEARRAVLDTAPTELAQYSPVNLAFQVIGWLYGTDFGDALCITVNCGYDTDSSGGSIGSWLGVLEGKSGLPARWIEPLGESIVTTAGWGGVRNLSGDGWAIPTTIGELTDRLVIQSERVLEHWGAALSDGVLTVDLDALYCDPAELARWERSAWVDNRSTPGLGVEVDYAGDVSIGSRQRRQLEITLSNPYRDDVVVNLSTVAPEGWSAAIPSDTTVPASGRALVTLNVLAPERDGLDTSNLILLRAQPRQRPSEPAVPVTLIGKRAWRARLDANSEWTELEAAGSRVPIDDLLTESGSLELQTFLFAESARHVRLCFDTALASQVLLNGERVVDSPAGRRPRPSYAMLAERDGAVNPDVELRAGWNEVRVHLVRTAEPNDSYFLVSDATNLRNGDTTLSRTRFAPDSTGIA